MIPVLALVRFVGGTALDYLVALSALLLVVRNPALLEDISEITNPISVTGVESVASELSKLSVSHLLSFFNLLGIQLNLCWIDCIRTAAVHLVVILVWRLHITIVIVILSWLGRILITRLTILLRNPTFKLVNGSFLQLLSHDLLFAEPRILGLSRLVYVRGVILRVWSLRVPL